MLKAVLDTYQAFHLPIIIQGLRAILVIGVIYLSKPFLMWFSIPLALIIGELFQVIVLFWRCCAVLNLPIHHLKRNWQKTPYTTQFLRQCLLMMGAAVSDGLNPVVDRGMASALGASSVSKLDYALRLCAIPETLTGVTLPVLLSHWAKISSADPQSEKGFKDGSGIGVPSYRDTVTAKCPAKCRCATYPDGPIPDWLLPVPNRHC